MTPTERRLVIGLGLFAVLALLCAGSLAAGLMVFRVAQTAGPAGAPAAAIDDTVRSVAEDMGAATSVAATPAPARASAPRRGQGRPTAPREALPLAPGGGAGAPDLTRLYAQVNPGVVSLGVQQTVDFMGQSVPQRGTGSGFVYDDRHIVTNNHVAGGAETVEVIFFDGQHRAGTVVGADAYSDLAVIRVDDLPDDARALPLVGDFASLQVGQPVVAIGNPFGHANSMTYGIISALGRTISAGLEQAVQFGIPQTIQTDAAINPGNSGGPLLDLSGQVIGINAQINTATVEPGSGTPANSGVGFAIPSSIVAQVVPVLIQDGRYEWSYLGVAGLAQELFTVEVAAANNLAESRGAYLLQVRPDGPSVGVLRGARNAVQAEDEDAASAIPVGGDVVVAADGQPIDSFDDLLTFVSLQTRPGQTIQLTILRDGQEQDVEVTVARRPQG